MDLLRTAFPVAWYPQREFARIDYFVLTCSSSLSYIKYYTKLEHFMYSGKSISYFYKSAVYQQQPEIIKFIVSHLKERLEKSRKTIVDEWFKKHWFKPVIKNHDLTNFILLTEYFPTNDNRILLYALTRECLPIIKYIFHHHDIFAIISDDILLDILGIVKDRRIVKFILKKRQLTNERSILLRCKHGLLPLLKEITDISSTQEFFQPSFWFFAVQAKDLAVCQYLLAHNCPFDSFAYCVCQKVETLQWLITHQVVQPNYGNLLVNALKCGYLEILRYCLLQDYTVSDELLLSTTFYNFYDVIKWYYEEYRGRKITLCSHCGNFLNTAEGREDFGYILQQIKNENRRILDYLLSLLVVVENNCNATSCYYEGNFVAVSHKSRLPLFASSIYFAFYENMKKNPSLSSQSFFYWNTKAITGEIFKIGRTTRELVSVAYRQRFLKSYDGDITEVDEKFFDLCLSMRGRSQGAWRIYS